MKYFLLSGALLLCACQTAANFQPEVVEIVDQARYQSDLLTCRSYAEAYHQGLDLASVSSGAISGGANYLAGAAVNPLVPVIGAVGGGSSAAINDLDLMSDNAIRVLLKCLEEKSRINHAYLVLDPKG